jgi:flavoprotein
MTSSDAIREYRVFHHKKTTHLTIEVDCLLGSDAEVVRYQLMQRLEKEFKLYDINVTLSLRFTSIALGEGNLKFKRFIVID